MILIDYSAILYKNLFSSIRDSTDASGKKIKKVNGVYQLKDYKQLFLHKMINDLKYIYKGNKQKYNEAVICLDTKGRNWRRDIYPMYKGTRKESRDKSEVDFDEFFVLSNELIDVLDNYFPFKVIKLESAEADDLIGVLAERYHVNDNILVVTHDKDFLQLFKYPNIDIYNPIKLKKVPRLTEKQLAQWELEHILLGDEADNVPKVTQGTEFSPEFLKFLKSKDVYIEDVYQFNQLSISEGLYKEYQENNDKPWYKKTRFGPVALKKFLENYEENMNSNPLYEENRARNEKLVMFRCIPEDIKEDIQQEYLNHEFKYNYASLMDYLLKNNLHQHYMDAQDFYFVPTASTPLPSSIDEW